MADSAPPIEPSPSDPPFEPTERLYRRIPRADVEARAISDASIPSPAFSVDREKYRPNPADMLIEHAGHGIAAFRVRDIPASLASDDGRLYEFGVEYRPLEENRAHSEVHSYQEGVRLDDVGREPPKHVRKKLRDLLRRKMEILELERR
ncbi:MAG TPA: hypothetical protein VF414_16935 [Thermoanaerobaculia bacterium]